MSGLTEAQRQAIMRAQGAQPAAGLSDAQRQAIARASGQTPQAGSAAMPGTSGNPAFDLMMQAQREGTLQGASGAPQANVMDPVQGDPTRFGPAVTRVADNVVGLDNGVMSAGEQAAAAMNKAGESVTLGLVGDEVAGRADELIGRRASGTGVEYYRQQERDLQEQNPALALSADLGGAMLLPGTGAAKIVAGAATRGGQMLRAAGLGAAGAATYGAAEGEGGLAERATSGAVAAPIGALFGAAGPKIAETLSGIPRRLQVMFRRTEERPTVEALRATKNAAYEAVEASGERFTPDEMQGLYQQVSDVFESGNYVEEVDNASRAALRILERNQGGASIGQLDRIRQGLWARYNSAPDQPQILDAIGQIDNLIESRAGTSELMDAARLANSRYAKSQLIEDAFTRATDQTASTGSGGNILNKYRQAVTSIINNPRKARFFSEGEIDLMRSFVRGTTDENITRLIGKLSPSGNGLMMALHTIGGVASQGMSLPLMALGAGAKRSADASVQRRATTMQNVIAGSQPNPALVPLNQGGVVAGASGSGVAADGSERIRNMLR